MMRWKILAIIASKREKNGIARLAVEYIAKKLNTIKKDTLKNAEKMVREIKEVCKLRLLTVSRVIVEKDDNLNFIKL